MSVHLPSILTDQMLSRVCGEYLEMPGLQLTRTQAQRLWGLDEETCTQLLDFLVEIKFLVCSRPDSYARLAEGAEPFLRLRMARAQLHQDTGECDSAANRSGVAEAERARVARSRT